MAFAAVAMFALLLALSLSDTDRARAQADDPCPVTTIGTLGPEEGDKRQISGSWTTEDCDSRFRSDSDAHTYRFEFTGTGRVRIALSSSDADSYLYLMTEDGRRIADDDDGGASRDARIERDLERGVYLIEATTVGGRERGAADFTLTINRVTGCDTIFLGTLSADADLVASGYWDLDTCGSRIVATHPAHSYSFYLPQDGRVRIDLTSENGDPVLSLASSSGEVVDANDDGGSYRDSRIEKYLTAGPYLIEATTYLQRDLQPLSADFTLTVSLVDEAEAQGTFLIKVEEALVPDQVVASQPFTIHYRVGNVGGGDLAEVGGRAFVYAWSPPTFESTSRVYASGDRWQAGVSYHTSPRTASATSEAIDEITPLYITLNRPGQSWVYVAVHAQDRFDEAVASQGIWRNLLVLSGVTFDPVTVKVEDALYRVSTEANANGRVTTFVSNITERNARVGAEERAKAIYAAGVHTQILDGILERPEIAALSTMAEPEAFSAANPSADNLLKILGRQYENDATELGLVEAMAAGQAINPTAVEDMTLDAAGMAAAQYAMLSDSWSALQERIAGGENLSFDEAFAVHSQLVYAESIIPSAMTAGEIVEAARAAEMGWEDPEVQEMVDSLSLQAYCGNEEAPLSAALEYAYAKDVDALLALDDELRTVLPVYSLANDSARCAASTVDAETSHFLRSLSIHRSNELLQMLMPTPSTVEAPAPYTLRIIAQMYRDGRVEYGVELPNGERVMPSSRILPEDSPVDAWLLSSDVEVDEKSIGNIRSRRLEDGRIEVGFLNALGEKVAPDTRYMAAGSPAGVWLRSSEIEAPPVPPSKDRPEEYTQAFVLQAIERYERSSLEETVAYYNTPESMDEQWYVFIFDENDVMLSHAANSGLVGLPASEVVGTNDYPIGEALVAVADADGEWYDYTYPNPASGDVESKRSWVVRHKGLVFGSGWYEPGPSREDAPAYTQAFVQQAINLYDALGYRDTIEYYNTAESVDGQWYVFIADQNDVMRAHASNPDLVGLHSSEILGPNGYPSGELVAASATEDGAWSDYTFPNPASGAVETKHSWVVRYDLLIFGSGWYEPGPSKEDEPAYTQAYVQQAVNLYKALGLERAVEYYSSEESVDDQWYVFIIDPDGYTIAHPNDTFIGRDPSERVDSTGYFYGDELRGAPEEGRWVSYVLWNPETDGERQKHTWAVSYDGLIFGSGWYEE